jgi:nitrite reductase (NADH) large subunit
VKTCVGTDWCRFGTQDSTGLGIKIEKFMWGSWTPAKVKMGVSGCPRNCAEATCKDFGVVCVDSGYEIHFAGAAGMDVKADRGALQGRDRGRVPSSTIAALVQLYREQGRYLERIYKWVEARRRRHHPRADRRGSERARALAGRFGISQRFAQVDPWAERAPASRRTSSVRSPT